MASCDKCGRPMPYALSGIIDGEYYKKLCDKCLSSQVQVSSGDARWSRTVDAEDHAADIMQPYQADGSINVEFTKLYPRQAQALFTPEEIDSASRK